MIFFLSETFTDQMNLFTDIVTFVYYVDSTACAVMRYISAIDPCAFNNGGCDQTCTNTAGVFSCECSAGYILGNNGKSCIPMREYYYYCAPPP